MSARRFPFGQDPARPRAPAPAQPLPQDEPRSTVPLVGFVAPERVLPFRPAEPRETVTAPVREPARPRARLAWWIGVVLVVLAIDVVAATAIVWRR